jgi:hypothetical protein
MRMVRLLLTRVVTVLAGAAVLLSSALAYLNNDWLAQTGLTITLIVLLVGGLAILTIGFRDLLRDLWKWHSESRKDSHSSS